MRNWPGLWPDATKSIRGSKIQDLFNPKGKMKKYKCDTHTTIEPCLLHALEKEFFFFYNSMFVIIVVCAEKNMYMFFHCFPFKPGIVVKNSFLKIKML